MAFNLISPDQYQELTQNCSVLKTRRGKPVILQTPDDQIIKHIYYRKGFSSSRIWPYAVRFINNSKKLALRGFIVPHIVTAYQCKELACDILVYPMIPGMSVRQHFREDNLDPLKKTPEFIASLHEAGIYFRDLHLENIVITRSDNSFALIDLASAKCQRKPLSHNMRARNVRHLFEEADDSVILSQYGKPLFLEQYCYASGIDLSNRLLTHLK